MTSLLDPRPPTPSVVIPKKVSMSRPEPFSRWMVPVVLVALAIVAAVGSTGFLEADELTHFLNSKKVWSDWQALLSIWGRLGCTAFYAPGAWLGLMWARLMAVGVTILVGVGTTMLLRHFLPRGSAEGGAIAWKARHATALVWLLLFAQPLFALNSFTVMTEMLLACTWVWAAVVLIKCRHWRGRGVVLAAAVLGLGGLMRPEGWLAIASWPGMVWVWLSLHTGGAVQPVGGRLRQTLAATYVAGAPTLLWYLLGVCGFGDWGWVLVHWPWAAESPYGKTGLHFLFSAVVSMGIWMWPFLVVGMLSILWPAWLALRRRARWESLDRDALLLLVVPFVSVFTVHGVLGSLGLFGSMSLPRYFLCVAPMAAVLALVGCLRVESRVHRSRWRRRTLRVLVVGLPVLTLIALMGTGYLPMWALVSTRRMDIAADEVRQHVPEAEFEERLILGHPYLIYKLGMPLGTNADRRVFSEKEMASAPAGTLLVIQQNLWVKEGRWPADQLVRWGYREDVAFNARADQLKEWHPLTLEQGDLSRVRIWVKE